MTYIRRAIKHESRAGRIILQGSAYLEVVDITDKGFSLYVVLLQRDFTRVNADRIFSYAAWNEFPLYRRDDPRLKYLTIRQVGVI